MNNQTLKTKVKNWVCCMERGNKKEGDSERKNELWNYELRYNEPTKLLIFGNGTH